MGATSSAPSGTITEGHRKCIETLEAVNNQFKRKYSESNKCQEELGHERELLRLQTQNLRECQRKCPQRGGSKDADYYYKYMKYKNKYTKEKKNKKK
jgi:hypothetical protein